MEHSMSGKTELFGFLIAAFGTIGALLTLQGFAITHRDVALNAAIDQAPESPDLLATRKAEAAALETGRMPIEDAKRALAERGRSAFPEIAPQASEDYSALSGWVHAKRFTPFVPPAPPPVPVVVDPALPIEPPHAVVGAH
jgi:hypothetical protein